MQPEPSASPDDLPRRIGSFRILRLLGEGSMGRVYLAEQETPHRLVALKVLRSAVASDVFRRRFRREIELMAALGQDGIARVYEAGETETDGGRLPYLVMEYIEGEDLLAYVERRALPLRQRLELLAALCRIVHAAHTRGVIHRDLKPANVLVDSHGHPTVLDFGVARLVNQGDMTQMTSAGQVIGTVAYMAWEQMLESDQVDARADVYALGVIAYRVISGRHPYPQLSEMSLVSAVRVLGEQTPRRLREVCGEAGADISTVVMKAMAREPGQRYASAAELAADIERVLRRQPIEARPPTAGYLLGLMVRRHKALAAAVGVALLSLVGGAVTAAWFAWGEARARVEAEQRGAEAVAANEFLQQMFAAATPAVARGRELGADDVLDFARSSLDSDAADYPPRVQAELRRGLGMSYNALGRLDPAQQLLAEALVLAERHFPPGSEPLLRTQNDYARVLLNHGRYAEAEVFLQDALRAIPADDAGTAPWRLALTARLGHAVCEQQRFGDCDTLLEPALAEARRRLGPSDDTTLEMMEWRCFALAPQHRYDEIEALATDMLAALMPKYGADHPRTFHAREWLAKVDQVRGDLDAAEARMRDLLADRIRVQGTDNIDIAQTRHRFGMLLMEQRNWAEAETVLRDAWAAFEQARGLYDVGTLVSMVDLSLSLEPQGRDDEAFALLGQVVARLDAMSRDVTSPDVSFYGYYAAALDERGRHAEALALFERMEPRARALKYPTSPSLGIFIANMGRCLANNGRIDSARAYLNEAVALLDASLGADHAETRAVRDWLAALDDAR
ncbi:serine/threonine-protein kinase [uncultured Abyssibacter sp.]|uniref:serine/threonine-protein kinase n=1 Tax=uncultured Abyssibacter sp. TaxID=2320202 RepID=UPI0032B25348